MFTVRINLIESRLSGLAALDKRRALGLPDASLLVIDDDRYIFANVTEGFARANFGPNDREVTRYAPLDLLAKGDLEPLPGKNADSYAHSSDALRENKERIIELWLACPATSAEGDGEDK